MMPAEQSAAAHRIEIRIRRRSNAPNTRADEMLLLRCQSSPQTSQFLLGQTVRV